MQVGDFFNCLQFDDDFVIDYEILNVTAIQFDALVCHRQGYLASKRNRSYREFLAQTLLIGRLQQTRTECFMDFYRSTNDRAAQFVSLIGDEALGTSLRVLRVSVLVMKSISFPHGNRRTGKPAQSGDSKSQFF